MKAQLFSIRPLRTMDQRWLPGSDVTARKITDMYYTIKDSWRSAGGYQPIVPDGPVTVTKTTTTTDFVGSGDNEEEVVTTTTETIVLDGPPFRE